MYGYKSSNASEAADAVFTLLEYLGHSPDIDAIREEVRRALAAAYWEGYEQAQRDAAISLQNIPIIP